MFTNILKNHWILKVTLGMIWTWSLYAQESASHTVTIRVVRPTVLNVKPTPSVYSSTYGNEIFQMEWQAGKKPKKITASIAQGSFPILLGAKEMGMKWTLSPHYEREILFVQSSLGNTEWMCRIKAISTESPETPSIIFYTMAEM